MNQAQSMNAQSEAGAAGSESINIGSALPLMALDEIPEVRSDAKEIIALVKSQGVISGYQLSDGSVITKEQGVYMADHGEIKGVGIAHNKGTMYLKSLPDGNEDNNLSHLPTINHTF